MTRAQRFAREWLWWVCGAMISVVGTFLFLTPDSEPSEAALLAAIIGLAISIPVYLVTGAIRLTLWAIVQVDGTQGRTRSKTTAFPADQ